MPKIKLKLSRFEKFPIAIAGKDPNKLRGNIGVAALHLFPGMPPLELDVTHEHLAVLIGDRALDVEIIDPGEKFVPEELRPKKVYDYPWQEAEEHRRATDKDYAAQQERNEEVARLQAERDEKLKQGIQPERKPARDTAPTR